MAQERRLHDLTTRATALRSRLRGSALAHAVSLIIAGILLLWIDRKQWFFYDDWDFITGAVSSGPHSGLFAPHNEHWSTGPILIYRALFAVVGVRSYFPYIFVLVALHLLAAHLLWRLMVRTGSDKWIASGLCGAFLVLGAGAENLSQQNRGGADLRHAAGDRRGVPRGAVPGVADAG